MAMAGRMEMAMATLPQGQGNRSDKADIGGVLK